MVPFTCDWNTINSWKSYYEQSEKDIDGNVFDGDNSIAVDTSHR